MPATQSLHLESAAITLHMPLQLLTGFVFAFRFGLTFVAFQSNPRAGTYANLGCSALLLVAGLIYTLGDKHFSLRLLARSSNLRWLGSYLAFSGISLLWTAADSSIIAAGYWLGMVIDVATVLLLVKRPNIAAQTDALLRGFVIGSLCIAAVAWMAPTLPDLRIGNEEFLHPNGIGLLCAIAFFLAQHLVSENRMWKWCCIALGITLLRTISKTSIVAFLLAEAFYLLREKQISRWAKFRIAAVIAIVVGAFGSLLEAYFAMYATAGDQVETLTGRTVIWSTAFTMAIESPWMGHGINSFRALMPAFGKFQPLHAHDELLQQFFEFGAVGVTVTVGLYFSLMWGAKRSGNNRYGKVAMALAVFCVVHGITDTATFGLSLPLWLFAAFAVALLHGARETETVR